MLVLLSDRPTAKVNVSETVTSRRSVIEIVLIFFFFFVHLNILTQVFEMNVFIFIALLFASTQASRRSEDDDWVLLPNKCEGRFV